MEARSSKLHHVAHAWKVRKRVSGVYILQMPILSRWQQAYTVLAPALKHKKWCYHESAAFWEGSGGLSPIAQFSLQLQHHQKKTPPPLQKPCSTTGQTPFSPVLSLQQRAVVGVTSDRGLQTLHLMIVLQ